MHAQNGQHEYGQIRQHQIAVAEVGRSRHETALRAHNQIKDKREDGGRQHNAEVDLELIAQAAALTAGADHRGVGNKREVVAKKRTAHYGRRHEGQPQTGLRGNASRHGYQRHNRAHRRTDGERHKAGCKKQARQQPLPRQQGQRELHRGVNGPHGLGRGGKRTGQHKNPNHQHHARVARTAREQADAFGQRQAARNGYRIDRSYDEQRCQRHFIEIAQRYAAAEKQAHKHQQGRERQKTAPARG